MNILIVTQYFWPESFLINDIATGLLGRGHSVTVLTGIPNYPDGKFNKAFGLFKNNRLPYRGIKVVRVPIVPRGKSRFMLAMNYLSYAISTSVLSPFMCRGDYDIILVYQLSPVTVGIPAIVMKWVKSAPIMFYVQDLWPESLSATGAVKSKYILKAVEWLVRFIYKRCDLILVQSEAFKWPIRKMRVPGEFIRYLPNSAAEVGHGITAHEGFNVVFAGNIGEAQDFGTILECAAILKNYGICFIIVGDGRKVGWVKEQIALRGLQNVKMAGRCQPNEMTRWYSVADALLVTLTDEPIFSLTIPSKLQSYLSVGKPIVAALNGEGARIIRESGAGVVCPAGNAGALANAILEVYHKSPDERCEMGAKGRAYFKTHFDRDMLLDRLEGWMKEQVRVKSRWFDWLDWRVG